MLLFMLAGKGKHTLKESSMQSDFIYKIYIDILNLNYFVLNFLSYSHFIVLLSFYFNIDI